MKLEYDEELIRRGAEDLYRKARAIVAKHGLVGAVLGCIAGALAGLIWTDGDEKLFFLVASASTLVGLLGGISSGRSRAFVLRFQAQQLLCQVQIERNTRALLQHLSPVDRT